MAEYENQRQEEHYLAETIRFISSELETLLRDALEHRQELIEFRRDMSENTAPSPNDFERFIEIVPFLSEVNSQTGGYLNVAQYVERYKKLLNSPYFGRFDFREDGFGMKEKIYIGLANVMDRQTHDVYVYDWRAPISSIFYRYEKGQAAYHTPNGLSTGEVLLKRQFKIDNSQLKYFFDCNIRITDEVLQEILSRNTSPRMRNIVETIQKEQDMIIRDTDNELLLVQGSAGSGKTSIALHRIAFLLYENLNKLHSRNIMIISPNDVFSRYISGVLPELGEENVLQATFDDLIKNTFAERFQPVTREIYLEDIITSHDSDAGKIKRAGALFKGSKTFLTILERWLWYYGHRLIPFEDVSFNGVVLETRQQLKNRFLRNEIGIPMTKQLQRIESMLLLQTHPFKKERLEKLRKIVAKSEGRDLEIIPFSRLLAIKESQAFRKRIGRFTKVDYWQLYLKLFSDPKNIYRLSNDLKLPVEIEDIITLTYQNLKEGKLSYEDYAPLLYLKLKIEGSEMSSAIQHVVIDEAQDYSCLQYAMFKLLFREANFTVVGDINQTIDNNADYSLYADIPVLLAKKRSVKLSLRNSYRSTFEINQFTRKLIGRELDILPFERHGSEPRITRQETLDSMNEAVLRDIAGFTGQGYQSIAVICKTQKEAERVHAELKGSIKISLIGPHDKDFIKGPLVVSSYMAKGLEFDVVIVYNVNKDNYQSNLDQKLLYISCTRALHELVLYYTGEKSFFC